MKIFLKVHVLLLMISVVVSTSVSTSVYGQKDTSGLLKYKIKAAKQAFEIFPPDNYLYKECRNKIKIVSRSGSKIARVSVNGGTLFRKNDSIYYLDHLQGKELLLSVYSATAKGEKPELNKQYVIVPYPRLDFGGVKSDSAIVKPLLEGGMMSAHYDAVGKMSKVVSFKMDILSKGEFIKDSVMGNKLNARMREYVEKLPKGALVYFKDINYINPKGMIQSIPIFRVFVIAEDRTTLFGF